MGYNFFHEAYELTNKKDKILTEGKGQYYGVDKDGKEVFVANSKEGVRKYARNHPEEGIVKISDNAGRKFNLEEALKSLDKKSFNEDSKFYDLDMLYESLKQNLDSSTKSDIINFVKRAKTSEEVSNYLSGLLNNQTNESLVDEDYTEESLEKLKTIFNELEKYLQSVQDKYHIWVDDLFYEGYDNCITAYINNGDWKHDHAKVDMVISEWLNNRGIDYTMEENAEPSDSDSYSSYHNFYLKNLDTHSHDDADTFPDEEPSEPEYFGESLSAGQIKKIQKASYGQVAFAIVLDNLSNKLDGWEEFSDGEFDISYQGPLSELKGEIINTFAAAGINLEEDSEENALVYSYSDYDAYIYIFEDDEASTYTENSFGYYARVETVL